MADTTFRPGDYDVAVLRKILAKLKKSTDDQNDFRPGDNATVVLRKILARLDTVTIS